LHIQFFKRTKADDGSPWEVDVKEGIGVFGPLSRRLGLKLHYLDLRAMSALAARLAPLGVTPARATAVIYIALHDGCDQISLGRALGVNRASTMKAVDELEALGALERRAGRDRRTNALHLTPAGVAMGRDIERITLEHDEALFGGLTASEREDLVRLLGKVRTGQDAAVPESAEAL
jgi:DNA-binding MarR family transcriptional regulator